jgi:hypothetical protein
MPNNITPTPRPLAQAQERMRVAEMNQLREAIAAYNRGEAIGVFAPIVAPFAALFRRVA